VLWRAKISRMVSDRPSPGHVVPPAQLIGHQIGHLHAEEGEAEGPAGILSQLDAFRGGCPDGSLDAIDGSVEVALGDLQGGLPGLTDLFLDPFQLDCEVGVAAGFPAHSSGPLLVLAGIRSCVGEDTEEILTISDMWYPEPAMPRAALYMRVSTVDQHPETQLHDLRAMAAQRGFEVVAEFTDRISGVKARRPGLDALMRDARRGRFDVVLTWACDRIARSTRHLLEVLDELNRLGVQFVSFREALDTAGPLGRAVVVIIGAIAELERSLIVERVRSGMRRARLEGQRIGRPPVDLDRAAILRDRQRGQSLGELARTYRVSRTTVHRVLNEHAATTLEKSA
jgi:DNA invertase Pin-like site-specific DNA recombinase